MEKKHEENAGRNIREEWKQTLYDFMNGMYEADSYRLAGDKFVKDEFTDGSYCMNLYEKVYDANRRICERLGVEEDEDVELIIASLMEIGWYLSMKMYDYGAMFSDVPEK